MIPGMKSTPRTLNNGGTAMTLDPNCQCFSCGWAFHVSPRRERTVPVTTCPACGSDDTLMDSEPLPAPTVFCHCQMVSSDARLCPVHRDLFQKEL